MPQYLLSHMTWRIMIGKLLCSINGLTLSLVGISQLVKCNGDLLMQVISQHFKTNHWLNDVFNVGMLQTMIGGPWVMVSLDAISLTTVGGLEITKDCVPPNNRKQMLQQAIVTDL